MVQFASIDPSQLAVERRRKSRLAAAQPPRSDPFFVPGAPEPPTLVNTRFGSATQGGMTGAVGDASLTGLGMPSVSDPLVRMAQAATSMTDGPTALPSVLTPSPSAGMPPAVSPNAARVAAGITPESLRRIGETLAFGNAYSSGDPAFRDILVRGALRGEYDGGAANFNDNITNKPLGGGFKQMLPGPPTPGTMSEDYVRYKGYSFDDRGVPTGMKGYNPPADGYRLTDPQPRRPPTDSFITGRAERDERDWSKYFGGGMP